ncbi:MAG: hypothetical protein H6622_01400 [Halobacteriovoraceae bacterium]|nr:hypothetical protein [Halobacteriovoraceae bacterium]
MLHKSTKKFLSKEVSKWEMDGIISKETRSILDTRYEVSALSVHLFIKYFSYIGGIILIFGILGFVGSISNNQIYTCLILIASFLMFYWYGNSLSRSLSLQHNYTANILLSVSLFLFTIFLIMFFKILGFTDENILLTAGPFVLSLAFYYTYRNYNKFLLKLTLISMFQWVGSSFSMSGRSSYNFHISDTKSMIIFSCFILVFSFFHNKFLKKFDRFNTVYISISLLYLNMCFLIETIHKSIYWVIAFLIISFVQILVGSKLKNNLILGFGITFLCLNIYTRYFESHWDNLSKSLFFIIGGISLFLIGLILEFLYAKYRIGIKNESNFSK